jgi:hypothetical protein
MVMKKLFIILFTLLALCSCEKFGKDGRLKQKIDYSQWYYDDVVEDDGKPRVKIMSFNVRYLNSDDQGANAWANRRKG